MILDARSQKKLIGVHPDLVKVVHLAADSTPVPFIVTEGLRTVERQRQLLQAGASRTMRSRHITGHAIDVAAFIDANDNGQYDSLDNIRWDWPLYGKIATVMKGAADELGVSIIWGGDWKSFKDGPHFELDREIYPAND